MPYLKIERRTPSKTEKTAITAQTPPQPLHFTSVIVKNSSDLACECIGYTLHRLPSAKLSCTVNVVGAVSEQIWKFASFVYSSNANSLVFN